MIVNLLNAAVLAGAPLLLGTLGEILTEKAGNLNLGVEGMMFLGAVAGLAGAWYYEQAVGVCSPLMVSLLVLLCSFLAGALGALIYAFLTVTLKANQNVSGLSLTMFGTGLGNCLGEILANNAGGYIAVGERVKAAFSPLSFGGLSQIPVIGKLLFQYNWMVYLGLILAIALSWFLNRTRVGLQLRAVGENPATADAAGINVSRYKYVAITVGGGICGIAGAYMSMVIGHGVWIHNCVSGYGWLSVALVVFSAWRPLNAIVCGFVFGAFTILRYYVAIPGLNMHVYSMLPYLVTIAVLVLTSIRQQREKMQPAGCGRNYFSEER